jgi:Ca2+-binding EF-hand superfamily protein
MKLIAKLKAVFDKFDDARSGTIDFQQLTRMLLYMNRPIDDDKVSATTIWRLTEV